MLGLVRMNGVSKIEVRLAKVTDGQNSAKRDWLEGSDQFTCG